MLYNSVLNLIKQKAPRPIIDGVNFAYSVFDPMLISYYRQQSRWNKPIPPFELRRITAKRSITDYVESGKRIADTLVEGLKVAHKEIDEVQSILDFGCGAGRQIQYFYDYNLTKIYGCDPNAEHIKWLSRSYPLADFHVSQFTPPLPFESDTFDLIYSVSVFTHLSENAQFAWLEELRRVLRPNQIALLTTLGEHAAKRHDSEKLGRPDPSEPDSFEQALTHHKFLFYVPESYKAVNQFINPNTASEEEMYGVAWHSEEYIMQQWGRYFEVVKVIPGCIDGLQDLVILIKS